MPGNWVYGGIFPQNKGGSYSIIYTYDPIDKFPVYADTVGQYTGLTDKNDKKIFEGDIVRCYYHCDMMDDLTTIEKVVFHQGAFKAESCDNRGCKKWSSLPQNDHCINFNLVYLKSVEVIGNIHDNPELLACCKGAENDT